MLGCGEQISCGDQMLGCHNTTKRHVAQTEKSGYRQHIDEALGCPNQAVKRKCNF